MIVNQRSIKLNELKEQLQHSVQGDHGEAYRFGFQLFLDDFFELLIDMSWIFCIADDTSDLDLEVILDTTLDHIASHFKSYETKDALMVWKGISQAQSNTFLAIDLAYNSETISV